MATAYQKDKYDIGILRSDGTTNVGLMLVKNQRNVPQYAVLDDEYLAAQYFTGAPGYGNLPAEKELAIRQESWRSGFGLNMYSADDPERYFESQGMDMRFRGMAIAGAKPATVTVPAGITTPGDLSNKTFEATTDWVGGSRDATEKHSGSYSWAVVTANVATQNVATWDNSWQGKTFTFTCWAWAFNASSAKLSLYDGQSISNSAYHTGSSSWEALSVSRNVNTSADHLQARLYDDGGLSVWFDDCSIGSPVNGVISDFAEFNDELYMRRGYQLTKLSSVGDAFNAVASFPANVSDLEPFADDRLYIGLGTATPGYFMETAETLTLMEAGVNSFQFFETVHAATPTLWGSSSAHQIRSTTTPTNALSWSGVTNVDTSTHSITDLLSKSGALYIMKEDMPYYLDSTGAVQSDLAPELRTLTKSTSGKNTALWLNKLYIPCGDQALLEHDAGTNTWRNPGDFCTNLSQFNGRVCAVVGDDRYLYAILDNGTIVYVLAGRLEDIGGTTDWVWHPIAEVPISGCESAFISSVYQKRLWIASPNVAESLYYIPLPTGYADVLTDTNASFATNVAMTTPWLHANFKDTEKSVIKLTTLLGHSYNTDVFFKAYYRTLENASYSFIGNAVGTPTSMVNTLYIPTAPTPTSTMFRLKFVANTLATDLTPVLLGYNLQALLYPPRRKIIMAQVRADQELTLKDGTADVGSKDVIAATLGEAREATWPVTLYNINGDVNYVKFLSPPSGLPFWEPTKMEKGRVMEARYNLVMQEVQLA